MGSTIAALAAAIGAVAVVLVINRKNEAATAMQAQAIINHKQSAVLTGADSARIIGTAAATYLGGPKAGSAFFSLSGGKL